MHLHKPHLTRATRNIDTALRRQTSQNTAQLIQNRLLIVSISVQLILSLAHTDRSITAVRVDNCALCRQPTTVVARCHVVVRDERDCGVDPRQDKAEVRRRRARAVADFGVIDVQPDALGQVGDAGIDERLRDGRRQVGVDLLIGLSGGVPGYGVSAFATEGDSGNALFRGFGGSSHCPREESHDA